MVTSVSIASRHATLREISAVLGISKQATAKRAQAWEFEESTAITLQEVGKLPFILPHQHRNPRRVTEILREVADITRHWESADVFTHYAEGSGFRA